MAAFYQAQQRFLLDNEEVRGIQNVGLDYNLNISYEKFAGLELAVPIFNGLNDNNVSIERVVISPDPFYKYVTGSGFFDGYILQPKSSSVKKAFGFTSGIITNYAFSYSIGNPPTTNITIKPIGNIGFLTINDSNLLSSIFSGNISGENVYKFAPYNVQCNFGDIGLTKIASLQLNVKKTAQTLNRLGNRFPEHTFFGQNQEVTLNVSFESENYETLRASMFPSSRVKGDVTISVNDISNTVPLVNFYFENMELISESYGIRVEDKSIINLSFQTSREYKKSPPNDGLIAYYDCLHPYCYKEVADGSPILTSLVPTVKDVTLTAPNDFLVPFPAQYFSVGGSNYCYTSSGLNLSSNLSLAMRCRPYAAGYSPSTEYGAFAMHTGSLLMTLYSSPSATSAYLGVWLYGAPYNTSAVMCPIDESEFILVACVSPYQCRFLTYSLNPSWSTKDETIDFSPPHDEGFGAFTGDSLRISDPNDFAFLGGNTAAMDMNNLAVYNKILTDAEITDFIRSNYRV